jgi:hypothetical protein
MRLGVLLASLAAASLVTAAPSDVDPLRGYPPRTREGRALGDALLREAEKPGKPTWKPMLRYLAELHARSVQPPVAHLKYPFETFGPGYQGRLLR